MGLRFDLTFRFDFRTRFTGRLQLNMESHEDGLVSVVVDFLPSPLHNPADLSNKLDRKMMTETFD